MDELTKLLKQGWAIEGYANTIMAAGPMTYSVLLRNQDELKAVTVVVQGGRVTGNQVVVQLAPL